MVGVCVDVLVGNGVSVTVGEAVNVEVGVEVAVGVKVDVGVKVGVGATSVTRTGVDDAMRLTVTDAAAASCCTSDRINWEGYCAHESKQNGRAIRIRM